jgi:hypothetical protein
MIATTTIQWGPIKVVTFDTAAAYSEWSFLSGQTVFCTVRRAHNGSARVVSSSLTDTSSIDLDDHRQVLERTLWNMQMAVVERMLLALVASGYDFGDAAVGEALQTVLDGLANEEGE